MSCHTGFLWAEDVILDPATCYADFGVGFDSGYHRSMAAQFHPHGNALRRGDSGAGRTPMDSTHHENETRIPYTYWEMFCQIREHGFITPISATFHRTYWKIGNGHHRLWAGYLAGIPVPYVSRGDCDKGYGGWCYCKPDRFDGFHGGRAAYDTMIDLRIANNKENQR